MNTVIMFGQVVSSRLFEPSLICRKCAKLLAIQRTYKVRLKTEFADEKSKEFCSRNGREIAFEDLKMPFSLTSRLKYDPSSDISWKSSSLIRSMTSQRNCGTPAVFNFHIKSKFSDRQHIINVKKQGFHTSSASFNDKTEKNESNSDRTEKAASHETDKVLKKDSIEEMPNEVSGWYENDNVRLMELDEKQTSKVENAKTTVDKTQHSRNVNHVVPVTDDALSEKAVSGVSNNQDLTHFDTGKQVGVFLKDHEMVFTHGHTSFITSCPKLGKVVMKKQQKTEGERLFINSTSGHFLCEYCQKSGSWSDLKDNITALRKIRKKKEYSCFENVSVQEEPQTTPSEVTALLQSAQDIKLLNKVEFQNVVDLFDWQGIKQATLAKFGAKYIKSGDTYSIFLPVTSFRGVVVGVRKFTASQKHFDDEEAHTSVRVTSHPRHLSETFGWQSVNSKSTSLVITGNEAESLAIIQKTDIPSIALKNLTYFPQELLPYLERFTKIILWFGNDVKAWQSSKQFAKKLNDLRCHVFRPNSDMLSPLEVIQSEASLKDMLLKARPIGHDSIVSFNKLRHEVYIELAQIEQVAGVKWKRYTPLNKVLKGHRPGELTVLTGPTGSGKTTFVSDYSLDLCTQGKEEKYLHKRVLLPVQKEMRFPKVIVFAQGHHDLTNTGFSKLMRRLFGTRKCLGSLQGMRAQVNTLWGSFEISNVRLAKVMLTQFAGKSMTKNLKNYDEIADQFAQIPMFFMTYFGQEETQNVIKAMSHAVYVHDIQHVIVDNLQFMMGMNYAEGSRFHIQDKIISMFRQFATKMNCHVTLIIHPRKEKDGEELMMASIFGSAKAVQEADNVLILQDMRLTAASGRKYVQVMKNRFDGELGVMMLKFDKESLRFIASQKKSASKRKDEEEEKGTADSEKADVTKDGQPVKFKKLDESGHSYDHILDIDKYYSS